jgi:cytochrome c oxidase assembly protein subunit 15
VRVSGAGLGCPDWPKCFGRWIPPTDVSQLPPGIDPAMFNFTLTWIEYINRLFGMMVGLIIAATAILALVYMRDNKRVLIASVSAALLVAFQGWQGSRVVSSVLEPLVISIHLFIALLIISVQIYMVYHTFTSSEKVTKGKKGVLYLSALGFYLLLLIQIMAGTQIRSSLETVRDLFPLLNEMQWLAKTWPVLSIHTWLGILLGGYSVLMYVFALQKKVFRFDWQSNVFSAFTISIIIQLVIGFLMVWIGIPPILQVLHLWTASIGMGLILFIVIDQAQGVIHEIH